MHVTMGRADILYRIIMLTLAAALCGLLWLAWSKRGEWLKGTPANGGMITTVTHDGHQFAVFGGNGGGICHHPDCPACRREH